MQLQGNKSLKEGYTLIELLVGITIISIVFTIGYAGFREFSRRQALSGVVKSIKADLRLAQQLASSGQKPNEDQGTCAQLNGYTLLFLTDSYTLTANCEVNRLIKTVTLPAGITETNNLSVKYKILGQGTNLTADLNLILTHTATGNTFTMVIGKGGDIN